jgi:hypothetical protein
MRYDLDRRNKKIVSKSMKKTAAVKDSAPNVLNGDVPADMPRHDARIEIIKAANANANQDVDALALVEISRRLRLRAESGEEKSCAANVRRGAK